MIRHALLLILFAMIFIGVNGCASSAGNVNGINQNDGEARIYEVFGMNCPGCHGGLEKLVMKIPSVQQAEANWKKKQLTIIVKPGEELKDEEVYDAIRRASFTAGERIK